MPELVNNRHVSPLVLILANAVPLAGVVWLDWAVFDIMILYWAENVVIGGVNVLRMLTSRAPANAFGMRAMMISFFAVHYGMFCFGHYSAVVSLFGDGEEWRPVLWIGVAAIAISHLVSFAINFVGRGEYRHAQLTQLMARPYGRIIVLHVSVILGAFVVTALDNPFWMLPVLVVIKTAIDLRMHKAERRILGSPADSTLASGND